MKRFYTLFAAILFVGFSAAYSLPNFWYSGIAYNSSGQIITSGPLANVEVIVTDGVNSVIQNYINVPVNGFGIFTIQVTGVGGVNMVAGTKITLTVNGVTVAGQSLTQWYIVNNILPAGGSTTDQSINGWVNNNAQTRIEVGTLSDNTTARPAGTEFIVKDDGKVGIGTTAPNSKLTISDANPGVYSLLSMYGPNIPAGAGNVALKLGQSPTMKNEADIRFQYLGNGSDANYLGVGFNNISPFFSITAGQKVGIGTLAPSQKLHVAGTVRIQDGTEGAGEVLTSDASGNASWQAQNSQSVGITMQLFTSNITVPNATYVPIVNWWIVNNEDGGSNYNPATGEYTISVAGVYQINATVLWMTNGSSTGMTILAFAVNGSYIMDVSTPVSATAWVSNVISYAKRLNVGDKVSFRLAQYSGAPMTLNFNSGGQTFSVQYLHK